MFILIVEPRYARNRIPKLHAEFQVAEEAPHHPGEGLGHYIATLQYVETDLAHPGGIPRGDINCVARGRNPACTIAMVQI